MYLQNRAEMLFLPSQVLQEYVRLVEDVETRLNLATKYKCHDVVIEVGPCCVCEDMGQEPAFSPWLSCSAVCPCCHVSVQFVYCCGLGAVIQFPVEAK